MSFENPLDANVAQRRGACGCGRHATQTEHDSAVAGSADAHISRVVESAVVRALFPEDQSRRVTPFLSLVADWGSE